MEDGGGGDDCGGISGGRVAGSSTGNGMESLES